MKKLHKATGAFSAEIKDGDREYVPIESRMVRFTFGKSDYIEVYADENSGGIIVRSSGLSGNGIEVIPVMSNVITVRIKAD